MNTLISTFHFRLHNSTAHLSNVLKLSPSFDTSETYYVENIKSTNFILVQTQNPRIYESTNLYFLTQPRKLIPTKKSTFTVCTFMELNLPLNN
jgi:hypothetical protein